MDQRGGEPVGEDRGSRVPGPALFTPRHGGHSAWHREIATATRPRTMRTSRDEDWDVSAALVKYELVITVSPRHVTRRRISRLPGFRPGISVIGGEGNGKLADRCM
jgi:hypothetical protein